MSTYDFEPNPDDYGPEPAHIANPSKFDKLFDGSNAHRLNKVATERIDALEAEIEGREE